MCRRIGEGLFVLLALWVLAWCLRSSAAPADAADPWDRLLAAVGLTRETCRFDFLDMANWGGDEGRLAYFHALHADPLRIPSYARILRQNVLGAAASAGDLTMYGAARIDAGTRLTLLGDPLADDARRAAAPDALLRAAMTVAAAGGEPLAPAAVARLRRGLAAVPADVQQQAALVLFASARALKWRARAFSGADSATQTKAFARLMGLNPDADEEMDPPRAALMRTVDLPYLMVGGELLAIACDRAATALANRTGAERFAWDCDTPLGRISLRGTQDDTLSGDRPYLLVIDTGGADTYHGGGATYDAAHPVSALIDLAGNDRYLETPALAGTPVAQFAGRKRGSANPTFGAGVLGYGVLIDCAGDDLYRSLNNTQGRGAFGVGILQDRAGADRYDDYMLGQGSAGFGVGILADLGGADQFRCFTTSQGFGDTRGFGLLVDAGDGADAYEANDSVIDFPSAQTREHNGSLSQGCGCGRRADYLDGHSLAGGIGALVDGGGANTFSGGLFAQGAGYWYGRGLLSSGAGDDLYRGVWYVQGAAAHFAVGVMHDTGGSDRYAASTNMAQGAGHDFSTGFLLDDAGNDTYSAPNLSLGGGNANGFGLLWDRAGDDTYVVQPGFTLGRAAGEANRDSLRSRCLTLGLFLDTGGHDTYPAAMPWARDGALWTMNESGPAPLPTTRGAGLDVEGPPPADPR